METLPTATDAPPVNELAEFKEFVTVGNQLLNLPPYLAVAIVVAFLIYKIKTTRKR